MDDDAQELLLEGQLAGERKEHCHCQGRYALLQSTSGNIHRSYLLQSLSAILVRPRHKIPQPALHHAIALGPTRKGIKRLSAVTSSTPRTCTLASCRTGLSNMHSTICVNTIRDDYEHKVSARDARVRHTQATRAVVSTNHSRRA